MPNDKASESTAPTQLPSSLLLCEALGFAPQLLLDDIINIANNAVQDGVNGMEEFLIKWVEEREEKRKNAPPEPPAKRKKGKKHAKAAEEEAEDLTQEVEQGLVAFQTLLEYHTDIAFDFFEAWSLRNIFFIPPELEHGDVVVLPHYEGANLTGVEGGTSVVDKEREMMEETEELRKRLDEQRRLTRLLKRGLSSAKAAKTRSEKRFTTIAQLLSSESLTQSTALPEQLNALYATVSSLPPLDPTMGYSIQPSSSQEGSTSLVSGTGKRPWELGTTGYVNWAVSRLVDGRGTSIAASRITEEANGGLEGTVVDKLELATAYVGKAQDLRGAVEAMGKPVPQSGYRGEGDMEVDG
ncbi:Mis12 protein-domain-containing protein [Coprinopsis sp. MPI-PUGE-AT-0042]|nr:Mis12 protein-domain-containing protein [Coprinopsis sp. MPI-PUGE-AT-0042]